MAFAFIMKYVLPFLVVGFLVWKFWLKAAIQMAKNQKEQRPTLAKAKKLHEENQQPLTTPKKSGKKVKQMYSEDWMGLKPDGNPVQITHSALMEWAYNNELQITVGWSHHFTMPENENSKLSGTRLVRGDVVEEARKQGWNDLADKLEEFTKAV